MTDSMIFLKYSRSRNELSIFADENTPRYVTCSVLVDYQTCAGADKFGNIFVLRVPDGTDDTNASSSSSSSSSAAATTEQMLWDRNPLQGEYFTPCLFL